MKRFFLIFGVIFVLLGILTDTTNSAAPPLNYRSIFRSFDMEIHEVFMSAPESIVLTSPGNRLRQTIVDA